MGQAKNRGTKDQRIAQAAGVVERTLEDVKKELGIPEDSEFLGYGVHLVEPDEFLAVFEEKGGLIKKIWSKTPEQALTFNDFPDAYETAKKCPKSVVVGIFDIGKQIMVAQCGTN